MAFNPQPKSRVYTATAGSAVQIEDGVTLAVLNATGLLATLTVAFPARPYDGQPLTIISPKGISAVTVSPPAGASIAGTLPTLAAANSPMRYKYCQPMSTWYPN